MSEQNNSPPLSPTPKISPENARIQLWHAGVLHWLLHSGQKSLYDSYQKCEDKIVVWNCSRRLGKSFTLCVIALETCLKTPNAIVKYCCAKQVDARGIIRPLIRDIIKSCPLELRPVYKTQDRAYVFPNGSRIELSGLDGGRAESIRGGSAHLGIIDEAGIVGDLEYIIGSIILPTTTTTKGKIILASTPPKTPDHPYVKYVRRAEAQGNLVTKTVYDNPMIDRGELQKIIDEAGGVDSIAFRREYLTHIIKDDNFTVVPEFTPELQKEIVREWPKPPFFDTYTSMDLGLKDLTVVVFAYYDFRAAKIIIEDEFVINGQKFNTDNLAKGIKEKEEHNFIDPVTKEMKPIGMRVSDNNLIVINDLYQLHGLHFFPTRKDDADAALNNMKIMLQQKKIIINPRCKTVIRHLDGAVWNKSKSSYERSGDNGHYDAIDALKYLVRNVNYTKNPYPRGFGLQSQSDRFDYGKPNDPVNNAYSKMFNIKKR